MHVKYLIEIVKIRLLLILVLIGFHIGSVNAQQKKSS